MHAIDFNDPLGEKKFLPPLFDRLTHKGTVLLTEDEVEASIREELSRLLNTRLVTEQGVAMDDLEDQEFRMAPYLLPDFFGLADFSAVILGDGEAVQKLTQRIQQACLAYEARLKDPEVKAGEPNFQNQSLTVFISGKIVFEGETRYVTFPLALHIPSKRDA